MSEIDGDYEDFTIVMYRTRQCINCKYYDEMNESSGICILMDIGTDEDMSCDKFKYKDKQ